MMTGALNACLTLVLRHLMLQIYTILIASRHYEEVSRVHLGATVWAALGLYRQYADLTPASRKADRVGYSVWTIRRLNRARCVRHAR